MISKRLKSVADFVDLNDKIVDVGCDHALLDIYLVQNNLNKNIIYVSDINQNALNNGIENINHYNLNERIKPFLGDGIKDIKNKDVDTLIISGMGTATIIGIISNKNIRKINKCIIQTNNNYDVLREYMLSNGFKLFSEKVIFEGHYYVTMLYYKGHHHLDKSSIKYGISNNIDFYKYLVENEKTIIKKIPKYKVLLRKKHKKNVKDILKCATKNCEI